MLRIRLARVLFVGALALPFFLKPLPVFGQDDEEEGKEGGEGEEEEGDDEEEDKLDKDQPKVTAGSLFNKQTYPISEIERPLSMTMGILEVRARIDFSLNEGQTFEHAPLFIGARYGISDTFQVNLDFTTLVIQKEGAPTCDPLVTMCPPVPPKTALSFGVETSIMYDLVDFRLTLDIPIEPDVTADIAFGFPIKYRFKDKIMIFALERIFVIHTAGGKPDLTIAAGGAFQVIPNLAIVARGAVNIPQFEADFVTVPVSAWVQFSPVNKFDIGLGATLGNLKAPEGGSPIDDRSLLLFVQGRI